MEAILICGQFLQGKVTYMFCRFNFNTILNLKEAHACPNDAATRFYYAMLHPHVLFEISPSFSMVNVNKLVNRFPIPTSHLMFQHLFHICIKREPPSPKLRSRKLTQDRSPADCEEIVCGFDVRSPTIKFATALRCPRMATY